MKESILDHKKYMDFAYMLAELAADKGEVPVGAVVVRVSNGEIIGTGCNKCESTLSPMAHAEIEALTNACTALGGWRLEDCVLYSTLEPCMMCSGAIINSRIKQTFYGAKDTSVPGASKLLENAVYLGDDRCGNILTEFFRKRRLDMSRIRLVKAGTDDQLHRVEAIADEIWHEYFPPIIGEDQTNYMVKKFCTTNAMKENISKDAYIYYLIKKGSEDVGYTAVKLDGDRLFLSKLYLRASERGKKYSSAVMELHKKYARETGKSSIYLTVNKHNGLAITVYEAMGFERVSDIVTDIGGGFVMDDYVYELPVEAEGGEDNEG